MSTEPEQIRAEVDELLSRLPGTADAAGPDHLADLDAVAARLEEAHDVLVRALEAVEQAPAGGAPGGTAPQPGGFPAPKAAGPTPGIES